MAVTHALQVLVAMAVALIASAELVSFFLRFVLTYLWVFTNLAVPNCCAFSLVMRSVLIG
jgi:hypothetical protein